MENVGSPHLPIVKVQGLRMNYRKISIINSHTKERKTTKKILLIVRWCEHQLQHKKKTHITHKNTYTLHTHIIDFIEYY